MLPLKTVYTVKIGYCQRWEAGQEFISAVGGASIADIVIHIHFPVQCRHLKAKVVEKNISSLSRLPYDESKYGYFDYPVLRLIADCDRCGMES